MRIAGPDMRLGFRKPGGAAASPLLTGLVSWWKMDETSGTRADSYGSNTLTDNNTVGYDTGVIGNAANFVAGNLEWLGASAQVTNRRPGWSLSCWVYPDTVTSKTFVAKDDGTTREFWLCALDGGATQRCHFYFWNNANALQTLETAAGVLTAGDWNHIIIVLGATDGKAYMYVDNSEVKNISPTAPYNDSKSVNLSIGARSNPSYYMDGRIDMVGIWERELTSDERATLYNSGNGLDYPFG